MCSKARAGSFVCACALWWALAWCTAAYGAWLGEMMSLEVTERRRAFNAGRPCAQSTTVEAKQAGELAEKKYPPAYK